MIPAWLQRRSDGIARAATLRLCPSCRTATLVGLDADTCALTARVDPIPIDEKGEAYAVLHSRATYDLTGDGKRKTLDPRGASHISKPRRYLVFAQHKCGQPLDQFAVELPSRREKKEPTDEIPF